MCGKRLHPENDVRYKVVVTVELKSCIREEDSSVFDDEEVLRHILEDDEMEFELEEDSSLEEEEQYKKMVFDLCNTCHKIYLKDPLFRNVRHRFGFTEN
ncbi:MAG: hypothetical protein D6805_09655 [Planctomycetota bacterium]|nr:MAG: hypothetical protein D6805_09655 [Planctomycetota bacterium]